MVSFWLVLLILTLIIGGVFLAIKYKVFTLPITLPWSLGKTESKTKEVPSTALLPDNSQTDSEAPEPSESTEVVPDEPNMDQSMITSPTSLPTSSESMGAPSLLISAPLEESSPISSAMVKKYTVMSVQRFCGQGIQEGTPTGVEVTRDEFGCLVNCQGKPGCNWYNYNNQTGKCELYQLTGTPLLQKNSNLRSGNIRS